MKVLKTYPQHFDSIFLLGTLAVQLGQFDIAEKLLQKAYDEIAGGSGFTGDNK